MDSVSRIILLQSSCPWRASEKASDPAFRGALYSEIRTWLGVRKELDVECPAPKGASNIEEEKHC
jgi:elongation factor P--beta-lysine ligase